jgi:TRAP-type C4-dicarboxylate transport system permease small subunit
MSEIKQDFELTPVLNEMSNSQRVVTRVGAIFCCLLLAGIVLVTTGSIFFRYVLSTPLNFSDQLSAYALAWVCFIGSGIVLAHGEHVAVDFFEKRMPVLLQKAAYIIYIFCFSVFLFIVIYYGSIYAWGVRGSVDPLLLHMSMMIPYLSVPVGSMYMLLQLNLPWISRLSSGQNIFQENENGND